MLDVSKGVAIFTDGSSHYKDRSGGWAYVLLDAFGESEVESGAVPDTTNNRMELTAAIEGLETVFEKYGPCDVLLYSDSEYVVLGLEDPSRARNTNQDLWFDLESAAERHPYVEPNWVRGHDDSHWNNLADELSKHARKAALDVNRK
jgi:ribonuclease HI